MKDLLSEGVEFVEGVGAEAAERVRLIQYPRNPLLLFQRREGDFDLSNNSRVQVLDCRTSSTRCKAIVDI